MRADQMSMKSLFVVPDMPRFEEDRAAGKKFEDLYGWIYSYSLLFDPRTLVLLGEVPAWRGVSQAKREIAEADFIFSARTDVSAELSRSKSSKAVFFWTQPPGPVYRKTLEVSPAPSRMVGIKEEVKLSTGQPGPLRLPQFETFDRITSRGQGELLARVGQFPALIARRGIVVSMIDLSALLQAHLINYDEAILASIADLFYAAMTIALGRRKRPAAGGGFSLRRDFHSFGVAYLLMRYLLELEGTTEETELEPAADEVVKAARALVTGKKAEALRSLRQAFQSLAAVRFRHSSTRLDIIECPHAGILFPEVGYFELEWPALSEQMISHLMDLAEAGPYRFSIEVGMGSLRNWKKRSPQFFERLKRLWKEGKVEVTNGTYSLPLAPYSPLELQIRQFEIGQKTSREIFGRKVETYVCQEFSFTPQFPGIFRDNGIRYALHATQNRGAAPEGKHLIFRWLGKDGRAIPVVGHHHLNEIRRGNNFYLEMPKFLLRAREEGLTRMVSVCLQDFSYLPMRTEVVRAHRYAEIFGRFATLKDVLQEESKKVLPAESFPLDSYTWELPYWGTQAVDWQSGYERVYALMHRLTGLEMLRSGLGDGRMKEIERTWQFLLDMESHDSALASHCFPGQFYGRNATIWAGPHSNIYLDAYIEKKRKDIVAHLEEEEERAFARIRKFIRSKKGEGALLFVNPVPRKRKLAVRPWEEKSISAEGLGTRAEAALGYLFMWGDIPAASASLLAAKSSGLLEEQTSAIGNESLQVIARDVGQVEIICNETHFLLEPVAASGGSFIRTRLQPFAGTFIRGLETAYEYSSLNGESASVKVTYLLLPDEPILFVLFDTEHFEGWPDSRYNYHKWEHYIALRVMPEGGYEETSVFMTNFRERTEKRRFSSPYFVEMKTRDGRLTFLNRGSLFYAQDRSRGYLDIVAFSPRERLGRRFFAVGVNIKNNLLAALDFNEHCYAQRCAGKPPIAKVLPQAVKFEAPQNVILTSLRPDGVFRLAETEGRRTGVSIHFPREISSARVLGERKRRSGEIIRIRGKKVSVKLSPYDILSIEVHTRQ